MTAQPAAAVELIPVPARRFSHIHVDLVGPLLTSAAGYSYLFTAVDRSTRWLEAIPLKDMSAASCADALISGWVSRFGVPSLITSDGHPIHLRRLGGPLQQAGRGTHHHDSVPSTGKWPGGEGPQAVKGGPEEPGLTTFRGHC